MQAGTADIYDRYVNVKYLDEYVRELDDILNDFRSGVVDLDILHDDLSSLRDAIDADRKRDFSSRA